VTPGGNGELFKHGNSAPPIDDRSASAVPAIYAKGAAVRIPTAPAAALDFRVRYRDATGAAEIHRPAAVSRL